MSIIQTINYNAVTQAELEEQREKIVAEKFFLKLMSISALTIKR